MLSLSRRFGSLGSRAMAVGVAILLASRCGSAAADEPAVAQVPGWTKWSAAIADFERQDRESPPPPGGVLFLGSSSIRLWDLKKSFPGETVVNRGFGGSQIDDSVHYADRLVLPSRPRLVVFYAGDNDIASGKSPERVLADFQALVEAIHAKLPETRIAFIAVKPSPSRWKHFDAQRRANALVAEFARGDARLDYVDIVTPMLGTDGRPRPELFVKDNLHLSAEGYRLWNDIVTPHLVK